MQNPSQKEGKTAQEQKTQPQKDQNLRQENEEKSQQINGNVEMRRDERKQGSNDNFIDQNSMDSFPTSDPPATY